VRIWNAASGGLVHTLSQHESYVSSLSFSRDSRRLASAGNDRTVRLWDTASGELVRTLSGHTDCVRSVCFSPDSNWIASGGDDKTVRLWHIGAPGNYVLTLPGHTNSVRTVCFSPDGRFLASGSTDNTIRLWEAPSGNHLATLLATPEGWAAITTGGKYKVSGNLAGAFWYALGLVRYEPGELDEFLPPGTLTRLQPGEPLF
jgi:WD40 repeat protein